MSAATESVKGAVWVAQARINDAKAMGALLRPLPEAIAKSARELAQPALQDRAGMRHDSEMKRAYYLAHGSDGVLSCITFEDVSFDQAAEMWAEIDQAKEGRLKIDTNLFEMVYVKVTGRSIERLPDGRS